MTKKIVEDLSSTENEIRKLRKQTPKAVTRTYQLARKGEKPRQIIKTNVTSPESAETLSIVQEMTRSFENTMDFYKSEQGGSNPHDEAVKQALSMSEWRREYVEGLPPEEISWAHISAVAEVDMTDALELWARLRKTADDELESGRRASKATGDNTEQFLAIRDSFADQWQPNGGIESAMIDMMAISFSLQLYWAGIAHQRTIRVHNDQTKELNRYENKGWKSPYQHEAGAIEQAQRLADGYNRQFLRILRQLRDLRRYSPVIIQNNGGQVNLGQGQVNVN